MTSTPTPIFRPSLFRFLKSLKSNNDREWFAEHKDEYERYVRQPSLRLIEEIGSPLAKVSPYFPALPKKVGGSLMRIYRDTRFGPDKTPYKINVGIQFRHEIGRDVHAPAFYVHLEPGQSFVATGTWRPASSELASIRKKIDQQPAQWKRVRNNKKFRQWFELAGESLKTAPRDYSRSHPLIDDLRRKDFIGVGPLDEKVVLGNDLIPTLIEKFRAARPWMQFLCDAAGVPF